MYSNPLFLSNFCPITLTRESQKLRQLNIVGLRKQMCFPALYANQRLFVRKIGRTQSDYIAVEVNWVNQPSQKPKTSNPQSFPTTLFHFCSWK
jgi:hypothetical protein